MGWIMQAYGDGAHVVPDTEPGHVLASDCFCEPEVEPQPNGAVIYTHRDELLRTVKEP